MSQEQLPIVLTGVSSGIGARAAGSSPAAASR